MDQELEGVRSAKFLQIKGERMGRALLFLRHAEGGSGLKDEITGIKPRNGENDRNCTSRRVKFGEGDLQ